MAGFVGVLYAQYQNFELKDPESNSNTYIGRDYVRLLPGYRVSALEGQTMNAKIQSTLSTTELNTFLSAANPNGNPESITAINTNLAVGEIPISSTVSPTGAKCYNVPIDIVPGRNGFQPNISISYNSQEGNGIVGMGWSINGLSCIERVNKNLFFDGENDMPELSSQDAFTLDGVRIIETSRMQSFVNYETVTGNVKIMGYFLTTKSLTGIVYTDKINYFKVLYPNGSIGVYRVNDQIFTKNDLVFPISSLTDINGNEIKYSYDYDITGLSSDNNNETFYIREIDYGKCKDIEHFAKIKFEYEERNDQIFSLKSNRSHILRKRLKKIESYSNTDLIKYYQLTYTELDSRIISNQKGVSRLTQIDCSNGSENLNPLKFFYGENGTLGTTIQSTSLSSSNFDLKTTKMVRGKFDNNIQQDAMMVFPDLSTYAMENDHKTFSLTYPSNEIIKVFQNLNNTESIPIPITTENGFLDALSANVDGVGYDEIIKINSLGLYNNSEKIKFKIYKPDTSTGVIYEREKQYTFQAGFSIFNSENLIPTIIPKEFYSGNFSGRGVTEILCVPQKNFFSTNVSIINLEDNSNQIPIFSGNLFLKNDNELILPIDIDGDGQTEIIHVKSDKSNIYKYVNNALQNIGQWALTTKDFMSKTSSGNFYANNGDLFAETTWTHKNQVFFADLNGDGKIDIIKAPERIKRHYKYSNVDVRCLKCIKCGALYGNFSSCANGCPVCGDREWVGSLNTHCIYEGGVDHWHYNEAAGIYDYVYDTHLINGECPIHGKFCNYEYDWNIGTRNNWTYVYTNGVNEPYIKHVTGVDCNGDSKIYLQDCDGDNTPELIVDGKFYALNQNNYTFELQPFFTYNFSGELVGFDINSDKKFTELVSLTPSEINRVSFNKNKQIDNMITLAINSFGMADKTSYDKLYKGNYYTPGNLASFPYNDYSGSIWVTTQNSVLYNKMLRSNNKFNYKGAILHKQGLGFLGFTSMSVTDFINNKSVSSTYDPYKMGALTHQISDTEESSFDYSFINYNRTSNPQVLKMKLLLTNKTVTDKLTGNSATTTYTGYDDYGNVGKETTVFGSGLIKSTIDFMYNNKVTDNLYIIGMPTGRIITNERDNKIATQSEEYEYYPTDNRLHYARKYIGSNMVTETEYQYNADYGTLSNEIVHNIPTDDYLTTSYTYWDDDKYSLKTETDAFGLTTNFSYFPDTRLLKDVTDYLGNKVSYGYDGWLRKNSKVSTVGTDVLTTSTDLSWNTAESEPKRLIKQTTTSTGQPTTTVYADAFGRETRKSIVGFDGSQVYTDNEYDNFGHLKSTSAPYKANETPLLSTYSYDTYNRMLKAVTANGSITNYSYSENTVEVETDGIRTSQTTDATSKVISSTDAGGTVTYTYRADGQPEKINTAGVETSFEYNDPYHRQTKLIDPSAGTIETQYNDANHKIKQIWNSGKTIETTYNEYGQPTYRTTPDFNSTYIYENGQLKSVSSTNGTSKSVDYDAFGRVWKLNETVNDKTYQEVYAYENGKVKSITYNPLGYQVTYKYLNGYLYRLEDAAGNKLRELNSVNSLGQETSVGFGNGLTTQHAYTALGMLTKINTSNNIQNLSYDFNPINGTLNSRTDSKRGLTESFNYGTFYRLEGYGTATNKQTVGYIPNGNIDVKTDAGSYIYNNTAKPYTLFEINTPASSGLTNQLDINYTVMSRPTSISGNGYTAAFTYNDDYDRVIEQFQQGTTVQSTKYLLGGGRYEVETNGSVNTQRLYLDGSPYSASVIVEKVGSAATQPYYLHRDYLGSITQVSDKNGNLAAEYSYDAWGRMRNVSNWQVYAASAQPTPMFGRGYTGHEHLNQFGLINMNARLYDPVLGRFMAADPLVANPGATNDYNRYVYAANNPLMFTDITGEHTGDGNNGWNYGWSNWGYGSNTGPYSSGYIYSGPNFNPGFQNGFNSYGSYSNYGNYGNYGKYGSYGNNGVGVTAQGAMLGSFLMGITGYNNGSYKYFVPNKQEIKPATFEFTGTSSVITSVLGAITLDIPFEYIPKSINIKALGPPAALIFVANLFIATGDIDECKRENEDARRIALAEKAAEEKLFQGSYTIYFKNGHKYHGKGTLSRMYTSAAEKMFLYGYEGAFPIKYDWTPSITEREAFKAEYRRMQTDRIPGLYPQGYANPINYNKIQSPGYKYYLQDGF